MKLPHGAPQLLEICHRVYAKGMVSGSGGNISIRLGEHILITPTGRNLGALTTEDLVCIGHDGTVFDNGGNCGNGAASKEWRMHAHCYRRDDVMAVMHVHSIYSVALSCRTDTDAQCAMPAYTPGYALRVGQLPLVPYLRPGSHELADCVGDIIIARRNSVLMANHGVLTVGSSLEQALNIVEEIEENAHLCLLVGDKGRPMTEQQQAELVGRY